MNATTLDAITTGKKPASQLAMLSANLERMKSQMAMALPKHMTADRLTRLALTAFSTTPALQQCTMNSIAAALMTAAQMGLEPGVNGQGYLIPYFDKKKNEHIATFVPGWRGLIDLVARAGRATAWTGAVLPGDDFDYQLGDAPFCRHRPSDSDEERPFTHVYAIGRVNGSAMPVIEVWSRAKVEKHLRQYNKVGDRHYARANENNFSMYARKVALLQVIKYLPQSVELAQAVMVANAADVGASAMIDVSGMVVTTPPDIDQDTGEITGEIRTPTDSKNFAPTLTFAAVMDAMVKAKTIEALDDASLGTAAVADEFQRKELREKYHELHEQLQGSQA